MNSEAKEQTGASMSLHYRRMLFKDQKVMEELFNSEYAMDHIFHDKGIMKLLLNNPEISKSIGRDTVLIDTDKGKQLTHKSELPPDYGLELVNDLVKDEVLNRRVQLMSDQAYTMIDLIRHHNHDIKRRYRVMMLKHTPRKGYSDTYKMLVEDMYDGANYLIWSNYIVSSYLQHQCHNIVVGEITLEKDKHPYRYIYSSSESPSGRKELMVLRINVQTEELVPVSKDDYIYGNLAPLQSSVFIDVEMMKAYRKQYNIKSVDDLDQGVYKITEMCQDKYRNGMKWYFLLNKEDRVGGDFVFRSNYWFDQEIQKYAHNSTITELYLTVTSNMKSVKGGRTSQVVIINTVTHRAIT